MTSLGKVADRLLSAFVPKAEAGACCPEYGTKTWRYCEGLGYPYIRWCHYDCNCRLVCNYYCTYDP